MKNSEKAEVIFAGEDMLKKNEGENAFGMYDDVVKSLAKDGAVSYETRGVILSLVTFIGRMEQGFKAQDGEYVLDEMTAFARVVIEYARIAERGMQAAIDTINAEKAALDKKAESN
jgi:hypothetical protein